jgi:hypothetical protein
MHAERRATATITSSDSKIKSSSSYDMIRFQLPRQLQYAYPNGEPGAIQQQEPDTEALHAQLQQREREGKAVQWQFQSSELLSNEQMEESVVYMGDRYRLRR